MQNTNNNYPRGVELIGSVIIENDEGEILVVTSPKWAGKWCSPGGHIEPGETIMEAQIREGKEETGLDLEGVAIFNYGEAINSKEFHRPAHFVYFNVHAKLKGGQSKLEERELLDHKWLKPEEALLLDLIAPARESIEKFIEYKK